MATRTLYLETNPDPPLMGRTTANVSAYDADDFIFIAQLWDPAPELDQLVEDIVEDPAGNIYVMLINNAGGGPSVFEHKIKVFDNTNAFLYEFDISVLSDTFTYSKDALFVTGVDEIYVLRMTQADETILCKFDHLGNLLDSWVLDAAHAARGHIAIVGDVCYYTLIKSGVLEATKIQRWDLLNDLALSDFFINTIYKNQSDTGFTLGYFRLLPDGSWMVPQGETFIGWTTGNIIIYLDSSGNVIRAVALDGDINSLSSIYLGRGLITKGFKGWANRELITPQPITQLTDCSPATWGLIFSTPDQGLTVPFIVTGPDVDGVCPVNGLSVDCSNKNIIITGGHFPDIPAITLKFNGVDVSFDIILISPTQIIIHPAFFANGTWCALVDFGE